jgi:hypothetical protein
VTATLTPSVTDWPQPSDIGPVDHDTYRDVHKGLRAELFGVTQQAGTLDPGDRVGREALCNYVGSVMDILVEHAEHEDTFVQPALERHLPKLAARISFDHVTLERRIRGLRELGNAAVEAAGPVQRQAAHRLYIELASFTSAYLEHQDVEERHVMPALEAAIGFDQVLVMHHALVASIPPEKMATSLAVMLPAMNIDDQAELLGGIKAGAPAEAFAGVWGLAGSVLRATDYRALGVRLGIA